MEKKFIATGKDFDLAVQAALKELGLKEEDVTVQLLERAKSGVFGIGARPCKVEVTYQVPDEVPQTALSSASRSKPKPVSREPVKESAPPKPSAPEKPDAPKPQTPKPQALQPEMAEPTPPPAAREPKEPRPPKAKKPEPKEFPVAAPGSLEEQVEIFLKGLLEHMGCTAVPHAWMEEEICRVEFVGDSLGMLIGRRGETLDAIQHLTNYVVNRNREKHVRINVDAEEYRVKREESLRRYARKKAQQVLKQRRRTTLEPMNAYERHIIHATLQEMDNITTYSTGSEPNRRITIEYVR